MKEYIWHNPDFPNFTYKNEVISPLFMQVKFMQGYFLGKMSGIKSYNRAIVDVLSEDVLKSNEIEGIKLNVDEVRSSFAKHFGVRSKNVTVSKNVQEIVDMTLDMNRNYDRKIEEKQLLGWHKLIIPDDKISVLHIKSGCYRDDKNGPMQVVSGAIGHEKVHYEAPPASQIKDEMQKLIDYINTDNGVDYIIKAGIVHLWLVIIHPFEDGNGRMARALTDLLLARSENSPNRFYSLSAQILKERNGYYRALEITSQNSLDITPWLKWFLETLLKAIESADFMLNSANKKTQFWEKNANLALNARQKKVIRKLLGDFKGKLTTSKWAKLTSCSQDTATRDITDLISKDILYKQGEGRATEYFLK